MIVLKEEKLIPSDRIRELNKLKGGSRVEAIINELKNIFGDKFNSLINTSNKETNIVSYIIDSINKYGWDNNQNQSLKLIQSMNKPLPNEGFQIISNLLQNKYLKLDENKDWITNPNSYRPIYKAKTLAFLSGKDANKYGDNVDIAKKDISEMDNEFDIKNYMSNWQTKSGESEKDFLSGLDIFNNYIEENNIEIDDKTIFPEFIKYIKSLDEYKKLNNESKNILENKWELKETRDTIDKKIFKRFFNNDESFIKTISKILQELAQ